MDAGLVGFEVIVRRYFQIGAIVLCHLVLDIEGGYQTEMGPLAQANPGKI